MLAYCLDAAIGVWVITFIYHKINGIAFPQKIYGVHTTGTGEAKDSGIIFSKVLTDKEKDMTLDELKMAYSITKE